jgi:hypothetical protein
MLHGFLQFLVILSLLGTDTFLGTLFWNTLSLYSYHNMRDQLSHPCKTTGKIVVHMSYVNLYILNAQLEDERFWK